MTDRIGWVNEGDEMTDRIEWVNDIPCEATLLVVENQVSRLQDENNLLKAQLAASETARKTVVRKLEKIRVALNDLTQPEGRRKLEKARSAILAISEFWNGLHNTRAMLDVCEENIRTAKTVLEETK